MLVREQLIQQDVVLLYVPFTVSSDGSVVGIAVLASGWSLRMARDHARLLGTDCKHDTSAGRSMWSSARAATPKGWVPTIAWVAPTETTALIEASLLVLHAEVFGDGLNT